MKTAQSTTDEPRQVDIAPFIKSVQSRLERYKARLLHSKQQCVLLGASLKEAENERDETMTLVDELSAQLAYLTNLPVVCAAPPPPKFPAE